MKIAQNHQRLKEDVSALRFINQQSGLSMDIESIVKNKTFNYSSFPFFAKLGGLTLFPLAGFLIGLSYCKPGVDYTNAVWGTLVGTSVSLSIAFYQQKNEQIIEKARVFERVYKQSGLQGLIDKDLRFDQI
jgi:hypothetical protein